MARKIGRTIRRYRERLGLTQAQAAEKASIGVAYLGRIERAERVPALDKIFLIATAVGATPSELLADCRLGRDRAIIRQEIADSLDRVKSLIEQL